MRVVLHVWREVEQRTQMFQLHMVQELFEVLGVPTVDNTEETSDTSSECHTISKAALEGSVAPQTIRFVG